MNDAAWLVEQSGFDVARANYWETLFTVGNGRLGTRGSLEEGHLGQLSGTFLAGVYDGHDVPVIDLVNAPDWLDTAVFVNGVRLDVDTATVVAHERRLDLRDGILTRTTVFADADGRRTRVETVRCASMADRGLVALRLEVTPEDHEADVVVETGIDGDRRNLERLPVYPHDHVFDPRTRWEKWARAKHMVESARTADEGLYLAMRTIDTGVEIGYRAETAFTPAADERTVQQCSERIRQRTVHHVAPGETLRMDKFVAVCTSRDPGETGPLDERCRAVLAAHRDEGFDAVVAASREVWARLWEACDCEVVGDERFTRALRFGVYHLLITANPDDPTVNIGAKSLSGEGYRGHVFWDTEIFMLPFFILTQPDTARALLRYRHHTLDGARENSREYGTGGARYAWESADTGREECPQFTVDGANRFWTREEEIHVSADVAYGIFRYVEATGDTAFLREAGAEVLFETSRFWVDRATPTASTDSEGGAGYELTQVMGPDEFHSHTDNNAFTNRLAQWHLRYAVALHDELRDSGELDTVAAAIGLKPEERDRWAEVADGLVGPRVVDGVIEQFTGYFERDDVPVTEWDENDMPRYPPGYHHFNCETTQLLKQPDVVMLMYLLPDEFSAATKRANFDYYEARTLHKSSLSPSIHAIIGMEVGDTTRAVQYFERSVLVDLTDNQGNTGEGMHIASAGGTWQILVNGFGGLRILGGKVTLRPWLPDDWAGIRFRIRWRGRPIRVAIDHEHVELVLGGEAGGTEEVVVGDETVALKAGEPVRIARPAATEGSPATS